GNNNQLLSFLNNISFAFSTNARNTLNVTETDLFHKPDVLGQMQNGVNSSIPLSASFPFPGFKYLTISAQLTGSMQNYLQTIREHWNNKDSIQTDTVQGLENAFTYNGSVTASTNLYVMSTLGLKKAIRIRTVLYLAASYNFHPDFSEAQYGYYRTLQLTADPAGPKQLYSIYQNGIFGGPAAGRYRDFGFSVGTNLEMKIRIQTDSGTTYKKIKLLERLSISTGYNSVADSFRWAKYSVAGNTTLFKKLAVNFSGVLDPYKVNSLGNDINQWNYSNWLGRLTSGDLSFSTTITGSKNTGQNKGQGSASQSTNSGLQLTSPNDYFMYEQMHPMYWAPIEIAPWSLTVFYNFLYSVQGLTSTTTQTVMFNGSLQLSKFWFVSVNSGYDLVANQFTSTFLSARRDMHCWELTFSTIPFGYHQNFSLSVHVKASVLSDLKLERKRDWTDTQQYTQ
ncbi:MAG TPA: putative LPS assembly protein LptD, partial [Bacteroidia bacterium]|nr:putative LPS assembly protein LptD [Bacteroidia bacterium]